MVSGVFSLRTSILITFHTFPEWWIFSPRTHQSQIVCISALLSLVPTFNPATAVLITVNYGFLTRFTCQSTYYMLENSLNIEIYHAI